VRRLLVLGLLATASAATAQPSDSRPARPRDEGARMIEAYIVSNLQESLGLSDDQFVKALPHVKKLLNDRREFAQSRNRLLRQMRRDLESGSATEAQIAASLKELKALEDEQPARIRKDAEAIDAVLTPLQQAKLRVLELEVERKIRELLSQIRRPRGQGRPGQAPPPEDP
jgi:hypothetical protein